LLLTESHLLGQLCPLLLLLLQLRHGGLLLLQQQTLARVGQKRERVAGDAAEEVR
jgi:hypothetical protein